MNKLLSLLLLLICAALSPAQNSPLVDAFVEALNKGDEQSITAFVKQWCSDSLPVADRVTRLKGIADQGAPFKVLSVVRGPSNVTVVLEDKNRERLGLKIELTRDGKYDRGMAGPPEGLNAPPLKDYTGWTNLQSLADRMRKDTQAPALGIAFLRNGQLSQAVSGVRSIGGNQAVGVDEPWSIGSIGKPICTTIIGKLIELGKLRWTTTLGEAFPGVPMRPEYKPVTIEQIMHHRGGIPAELGMRRPDVLRIVAGETDPRKIRANYVKDILSKEMAAKPGTRFIYSNGGFALLGALAERVTGQPYEKLVHRFVFSPLKLRHSFTAGDSLPKSRPSGHVVGPNGLEVANFSGPIEILFAPAGGGIFMSLGDLARFGRAHLDGLRGKDGLLMAATIRRLHQGMGEGGPEPRQYACGWGIESHQGLPTMHTHNGSNGTMRAQLAIFPDSGLVVASFVNAGGESEPSPPLQAVLAVAKKYAK